jgi:hypothetical protein
MNNGIKNKIALQPLAKLNAVLVAKGMIATNNKDQAINEVTALIATGHATLDDLNVAVVQAPASAVVPDDLRDQIQTASSRALDAVQQVENAQSSLFRLRDEIDKNVNTFKQDFGKLDADLRRKLDSIQRPVVDQSAIDATIRASVSQLFNEFRGETKREVLHSHLDRSISSLHVTCSVLTLAVMTAWTSVICKSACGMTLMHPHLSMTTFSIHRTCIRR